MLFDKKPKTKYPQPQPQPSKPSPEPPNFLKEEPAPEPLPTFSEKSSAPPEPSAEQVIPTIKEGTNVYEADLTTSISRNTSITGDIISEDNVDIFGIVKGNVTSEAVVKIYGEVTGDVRCATMVANGAKIFGNTYCTCSTVIGDKTIVEGTISTGVINISGTVTGNVTATESATISRNGYVLGDISTPSIEVAKGAILFGALVMDQKEPEPPVEESPKEITPPNDFGVNSTTYTDDDSSDESSDESNDESNDDSNDDEPGDDDEADAPPVENVKVVVEEKPKKSSHSATHK